VRTARFSVRSRSILITGATGSLGGAAARALAEAGARLTLTGGNAAGLAKLVDEAGIENAAVVTRRPDTPDDAQAMVEAALAPHGHDREEQTEGICAVGAVLKGVSEQMVAVSVPVPAQRFYRRESELAQVLLSWVERVDAWFEEAAGR
jgi:NAD(P)-dependent dehydrogenase (short-subunit alcohol dehydrogenase family)